MIDDRICVCCFNLEFYEEDAEFCLDFDEEGAEFCLDFGEFEIIHIADNPYEGPYTVIPKAWDAQILSTRNKAMLGDVTVLEVPYAEVSNPNGTTVVIAS